MCLVAIGPAGIYMFKVNGNTRRMCEICAKLIIKTPEQRHSVVFTVNLEKDLHIVLVFPL